VFDSTKQFVHQTYTKSVVDASNIYDLFRTILLPKLYVTLYQLLTM
jgi:hypothetical protein